jgi:hypothetical protein
MNFFKLFLRGIALLPGVIQAVEGLFGAKSGDQKKTAALSIVKSALNLTDAVSEKQIVDADSFTEGLGKIVDGVVECLNASIWAVSK